MSAPELPIRTRPFPDWINDNIQKLKEESLDLDNTTCVEFTSNQQLYELLCEYLVEYIDTSYKIEPKPNVSKATRLLEKLAREAMRDENEKNDKKTQENDNHEDDKLKVSMGLGLHSIIYNNTKLYVLHQTLGEPQGGSSCEKPSFHTSLTLLLSGKGIKELNFLKQICIDVIEKNESHKEKFYFKIYRWECKYGYWRSSGKKIGRKLDTIILPEIIKNKLITDIERFLDEKSIKWYFKHGIPYKRSYLFYGVPGSGKSSLIQSLALHFNRNVAYLQPTHPEMTDDSFKQCISTAPSNSLIILEDIDALFNKDRSKKHASCPLTFSGLLNGLDGVGNPDGQIFILTTNFVNQLDDALIRSGRVDVHIHFPLATDEQIIKMFELFYENQCTNIQSKEFLNKIRKFFPKGISMAALQQHFISNMLETAEHTINAVEQLGDRLDVVSELNEKTKIKEEKDDDEDDKDKDKDKDDEKKKDKKDEDDKDKDKDKKVENGKLSKEQMNKFVEKLKTSFNDSSFSSMLDSMISKYNDIVGKEEENGKEKKKGQ